MLVKKEWYALSYGTQVPNAQFGTTTVESKVCQHFE